MSKHLPSLAQNSRRFKTVQWLLASGTACLMLAGVCLVLLLAQAAYVVRLLFGDIPPEPYEVAALLDGSTLWLGTAFALALVGGGMHTAGQVLRFRLRIENRLLHALRAAPERRERRQPKPAPQPVEVPAVPHWRLADTAVLGEDEPEPVSEDSHVS